MPSDKGSDNGFFLMETELGELWRFRQEHKDAEEFHQRRRKQADEEILRRARLADAQILATQWGDIVIVYSSEYAYDTIAVDHHLWPLIERDGLQPDWNQFVSHTYKIKKVWLNRLEKRGPEYREAIERITIANKGNPRVADGPSLEAMGGYIREPEEAPS